LVKDILADYINTKPSFNETITYSPIDVKTGKPTTSTADIQYAITGMQGSSPCYALKINKKITTLSSQNLHETLEQKDMRG